MTQATSDTIRAATYLAEKDRIDAPTGRKLSTRTGKTKRKVTCTPPNKKCGGRCIPPNWDCRIKGQGTNSELRTHRQDPAQGIASIQRGAKDLVGGIRKADPARFQRGRGSIVRGIVKISPGDDLEKKKKLRRTLEARSSLIAGAISVGLLGIGAHLSAKKIFSSYRTGKGKDIDDAAKYAYGAVLDRIPYIGAQRAAVRARGAAGIGGLGVGISRGASLYEKSAGLTQANPKKPGLVSSLGRRTSAFGGSGTLGQYDELVRTKPSLADFRQRGTEIIFGAQRKGVVGGSVFSPDAANSLTVKQWGLNPEGILGKTARGNLSPDARRTNLVAGLSTKLGSMSSAMNQDMRQRGMSGKEYMKAVIKPQLITSMPKANKGQMMQATNLAEELIADSSGRSSIKIAKGLIGETEKGFDKHFSDLHEGLKRNAGLSTNALSPKDEGLVGMANFVMSSTRGQSATRVGAGRMVSVEHANLYIEAAHHNKIAGNTGPLIVSRGKAATVARQLSGGAKPPKPEDVLKVLETQGGIRASYGNVAISAKPSFTRTGGVSKTGLGVQSNLSNTARAIMSRKGNENMTMAQAIKLAKAEERRRKRGDEDELPIRVDTYMTYREDLKKRGKGKKCGNSYIPRVHKCGKQGGGASTASSTKSIKAVTPKEKGSKGKAVKIALAVAAAGLTTGGILAYKKRNVFVPSLSKKTIEKLSSDQIKAGLDRLPSQLQEPARNLVGGAKLAAAHMALKAQGMKIRAVDIEHNFTTWTNDDGTQLSVGSVGGSLLTFGAQRKGNTGKFPTFGLGFTVDSSYDSKGGIPSSEARQLIKTTKGMFKSQMEMLPKDAFLFAVPHKDDGLGSKRKSIYEKMGFVSVPGVRGDKLWALKNQGNFTSIPEDQYGYIAQMLRKDSDDTPSSGVGELPIRVKTYLQYREDLKKGRPGKKCGDSHIPQKHECSVGAGSAPKSTSKSSKSSSRVSTKAVWEPKSTSKSSKSNSRISTKAVVAGAAIAATLGAGAYLRKREFHTGARSLDIDNPAKRRLFEFQKNKVKPLSTKDIVNAADGLKKHSAVEAGNVQRFQNFVQSKGVKSDASTIEKDFRKGFSKAYDDGKYDGTGYSKKKIMEAVDASIKGVKVGAVDGLAGPVSNNIYVRSSSTGKGSGRLKPDADAVVKGSQSFFKFRKDNVDLDLKSVQEVAAREGPMAAVKLATSERFKKTFSMSRNMPDGDASEFATLVHETAHLAHFSATKRLGGDPFRGALADPANASGNFARKLTIEKDLRKAASNYGRTDLGLISVPGGGLQEGRKAETFAELSVQYVTNGKQFKRDYPDAYDWVDTIWKNA